MEKRKAQVHINLTCKYCSAGTELCCSDCDVSVCDSCIKKHLSITGNDNHAIIKYSNRKTNNICKLHTTQKHEFYCHQCLEPVCKKCILGPHKSHPLDNLMNEIHQKQIELKNDTFELETLKSQYKEQLSNVDEMKSEHDEIDRFCEEQAATLKRKIGEVFKELKSKSDKMKTKNSKVYDEYHSKLKGLFGALKERIRKNKELLDSGDGKTISSYTSKNEYFRKIPELPQLTDPEFEHCTELKERLIELIGNFNECLGADTLMVAIHSLDQNTENCLSFKKGDLFEVALKSSSQGTGDWYYAIHKTTGKRGYVPKRYVRTCTDEESSDD